MDFSIVLALAGIVAIIVLIVLIFLIPGEKKARRKKKQAALAEPTAVEKQQEEHIHRLEHTIRSQREKIGVLEKQLKEQEKKMAMEELKVKKIKEKLEQERSWQEKEQTGQEKRTQEYKHISDGLKNTQEIYAKEHSLNIRLEKELKEIKVDVDRLNDQRRAAEAEAAYLKTRIEQLRAESAQVQKDYNLLKKKEEDTQWIAKPEYDRLEKQHQQLEKELARLKRDIKNETP